MLIFPTLPAFEYCSEIALTDDGSAPTMCHIDIIEYVLIAVLRLQSAAWNNAVIFAAFIHV